MATLPLLVACAEFDPPRFQAETLALLRRTLRVRVRVPLAHLGSGHNHHPLAVHFGTSDPRLADEISLVRARRDMTRNETRTTPLAEQVKGKEDPWAAHRGDPSHPEVTRCR